MAPNGRKIKWPRQIQTGVDRFDERDARRAKLPDVFQRRLDGFEKRNPVWRRDFEPYELFCCEEAVKFAERFPDDADLRLWAGMKFAEQKRLYPDISDGHSGNTFAIAVRLAHWYIVEPENVVREHGAMCPLAGCISYGCPQSENAEEYTGS